MDIQQELIAEFDRETAKNRKMFEAIPADADFSYKPHAKSMSLGQLAGHITDTSGDWVTHTLTQDEMMFPADHKFEPNIPSSKDVLLEKYDQAVAASKAALVEFAPEKWDTNWKFGMGEQVWIDDSKYRVFRNWVLDHMVHHRAQLGVYLRLLGQPIPGSFGPSADEM
jgi:uncharacterized damage-inducible protein DinB